MTPISPLFFANRDPPRFVAIFIGERRDSEMDGVKGQGDGSMERVRAVLCVLLCVLELA